MVIVGLDKDWNVLEYDIPFTNMVWHRRYFEAGEFQMQIPASVYNPDIKFLIDLETNKEIANVQKMSYSSGDGGAILLSGFFAEKILDNYAIYQRYSMNGSVERLCKALFDNFYSNDYGTEMHIGFEATPESEQTSATYDYNAIGGQLGAKMFSMLETRGLSYRVRRKIDDSAAVCKCWGGIDRSSSQTAREAIILRQRYGDITDISYEKDTSAYKNTVRWNRKKRDDDIVTGTGKYYYEDEIYGPSVTPPSRGGMREICLEYTPGKDDTEAQAYGDFVTKAVEKLTSYDVSMDVDAKVVNTDLIGAHKSALCDLGDIITLSIDEIGVRVDTRIIEIEEVWNREGRSANCVFGNKRISNMRRAFNSWL